jgi:beta-alanine--pyruvate transaminase
MDTPNDLEPYWMPFTANRRFKAHPRLVVAAEGMHYTTAEGTQLLDGTAGLWCVNAGHKRAPIIAAIAAQAAELDFAPSFQFSHPLAFTLAARLTALLPGFSHVFFANSGSEAVDTALKIALAYHRIKGQGTRTRLIGRERGYHGTGFGGISVGGIAGNRKQFGAMLPGTDHLPHTHDLARNAFSRGLPQFGAERADVLESLVALHDASTVAAVIVEPVAGSAGVLVPPKAYLQRLRAICDKHGILLIFDEVITGFGRLGAPFAADYFGVKPVILCMAKGLTNGAVPMGAVAVREGIYEAFMQGPSGGIEFFHGYTYSGHPLAAAAGLATLDLYQGEGLFERARMHAPHWEQAIHGMQGLPHIIDIRNIGLMGAIELEPRADAPGARGAEAFARAWDAGLLIRVTGDIIALSPPLIIGAKEIDRIFSILGRVLKELP